MPAAIQAPYFSEIVSSYDLHKPEKQNILFQRYGNQGIGFHNIIRSMGFELATANDTYGHYEDDWIHEIFHSNGNVSDPGAGNDILITLSSDDLDANNRFYPRVNDVVTFPNEVTGYIHSIDKSTPTAPVLTIRLNDETDTFGAVTAGDELMISSGIASEASGQPDPAFSGTYQYDNDCQIIKETIQWSGTEMTNQDWVDVMENGVRIGSYNKKGQIDIDFRMSSKIDGAMLTQKRTTNPNAVDPETGNPYKSTEGLIPFMRRLGHEYPKASGALDIPDFDAIERILDQEYCGNSTMAMPGIKRHQNVENALVTYFSDTNINYVKDVVNETYFGGVDSLGASVNFKYLRKGERIHMFKRMNNFNNPKTFGAAGYGYADMMLMIPMNKNIRDPKNSANSGANIGSRYKALGDYNRKMEAYTVGGAGNGLKVTEYDKRDAYQRAHIGGHFRKGNQFLIVSV